MNLLNLFKRKKSSVVIDKKEFANYESGDETIGKISCAKNFGHVGRFYQHCF